MEEVMAYEAITSSIQVHMIFDEKSKR